jgi:hypothetical protein
VPALFLQGACGDQEAENPHSPATTEHLGEVLGQEVVDVLGDAVFTAVTGPVSTSLIEIDLPFHVDTSDPDVQAELRVKYQARSETLGPLDPNGRHAALMIQLMDDGELPTAVPMPIQRWRFSGLSVVALAHEPLSAYDVKLRAAFPGKLWVVGYANECEGYVADNDTLRSGGALHAGYEAGWNEDDDTIAGFGSFTVSYAWPSPLKFSDTAIPAAGTTERIVLDACTGLLKS